MALASRRPNRVPFERWLFLALAVIAALVAADPAFATFHLWQIEEIFSNADGTIQYVEFSTTFDNQHLMQNHVLRSLMGATVQHDFTFPSNLGSNLTGNHFMLVATPAFAATAGITPDYVLPPGKFIELNKTNTITLVGAATPSFTYTPASLPTDGIHSLTLIGGIPTPTVATPRNFANQTGTMEPACSDSVDNDGDGRTDFPADVGCFDANWTRENPQCQDGLDNDLDGKIDFDGGAALNGGVPLAPIDPQCSGKPHRNRESASSCGDGEELSLLAPIAWAITARARKRA
jgi:hypothetical protein